MKTDFDTAGGARLQRLYDRLSVIPEGAEIVAMLKDNAIPVLFEKLKCVALTNTKSYIEDKKTIYGAIEIWLDRACDDDTLLQALIHESQHVRHHLNGVGNPDFLMSAEDEYWVRRIQEADAQAKTAEITYFLKRAGDSGPFIAAQKIGYAETGTAFEDAFQENPATAKRAAFDAWFCNAGWCAYYDRNTRELQLHNTQSLLKISKRHNLEPTSPEEKKAWALRIGGLSSPNYMQIPGLPEIDSVFYKRNIGNSGPRPAGP